MKRLIAIAPLLLLASCETPTPQVQSARSGNVVKVATAPDGTTLWATRELDGGNLVYFASSVTQHSYAQGKTTRTDVVPSTTVTEMDRTMEEMRAVLKRYDDAKSAQGPQ